MGHCKFKCSLCCCSTQQVWRGLPWGLRVCQFVEISRGGGSTRQSQRTEPCQCESGQPWVCHGALQGQVQPLQCAAGVVEPALGAAAGLVGWFVGVAVLPVCGDFQRRRQHSTTAGHRALPVCEWPAPGMPWATSRSNVASAARSKCGGACSWCCVRAGQVV